MQIKIEIDVQPEELRRFLGLPDVAALPEDLVRFLRDKVGITGEAFDPVALIDALRRSRAFRRILYGAESEEAAQGAGSERKSRRRTRARRKSGPTAPSSD